MNSDGSDRCKKALAHMQRLCARREYCRFDLDVKLRRYELEEKEREEILKSLVRDGFLDDSRYARAFVRDKTALNGWGPVKVRMALRQKRIDDTIIDGYLGEIPGEKTRSKLESLLRSKAGRVKEDEARVAVKAKLTRFALSRGFDYGMVIDVVDDIMKDIFKPDKN